MFVQSLWLKTACGAKLRWLEYIYLTSAFWLIHFSSSVTFISHIRSRPLLFPLSPGDHSFIQFIHFLPPWLFWLATVSVVKGASGERRYYSICERADYKMNEGRAGAGGYEAKYVYVLQIHPSIDWTWLIHPSVSIAYPPFIQSFFIELLNAHHHHSFHACLLEIRDFIYVNDNGLEAIS